MKKIFVIAISLMISMPLWSAIKVGKIDFRRVVLSIDEGQSLRDKIKGEFDKRQATLKKDEDAFVKNQEEYKKQAAVMNAKAKEKKEKELQEAYMSLQQKSAEYQKEIQDLEEKLQEPLFKKIQDIAKNVSEDAGVDVSFEASRGQILYAKELIDLTDKVIKAYNDKFPVKK